MKENVQGFHLCSGFSHKYFLLTALCVCVCIYIYMCVCVCVCVYIYVCVCVYICVCVVSPKIIMHLLFMYPCMSI